MKERRVSNSSVSFSEGKGERALRGDAPFHSLVSLLLLLLLLLRISYMLTYSPSHALPSGSGSIVTSPRYVYLGEEDVRKAPLSQLLLPPRAPYSGFKPGFITISSGDRRKRGRCSFISFSEEMATKNRAMSFPSFSSFPSYPPAPPFHPPSPGCVHRCVRAPMGVFWYVSARLSRCIRCSVPPSAGASSVVTLSVNTATTEEACRSCGDDHRRHHVVAARLSGPRGLFRRSPPHSTPSEADPHAHHYGDVRCHSSMMACLAWFWHFVDIIFCILLMYSFTYVMASGLLFRSSIFYLLFFMLSAFHRLHQRHVSYNLVQ